MARARAKNYRVNLIEAFDQPWKRYLEGTVGGYWGLFGSDVREPKFAWGEPVSDHHGWICQLILGLTLTTAVLAAAIGAGGSRSIAKAPGRVLAGVAALGLAAGIAGPWGLENVVIESLGPGGWLRGAALAAVALAAPVVAAMALAANEAVPAFARVLGRDGGRPLAPAARAGGLVLAAATVLAIQAALGLVFDPRYRDFPDAQLSAAVVPFAVAMMLGAGRTGPRGRAETVAAATLAGSAVYIVLNESLVNWQALWFGAILILLAFTLDRLRDVQST